MIGRERCPGRGGGGGSTFIRGRSGKKVSFTPQLTFFDSSFSHIFCSDSRSVSASASSAEVSTHSRRAFAKVFWLTFDERRPLGGVVGGESELAFLGDGQGARGDRGSGAERLGLEGEGLV